LQDKRNNKKQQANDCCSALAFFLSINQSINQRYKIILILLVLSMIYICVSETVSASNQFFLFFTRNLPCCYGKRKLVVTV